MVGYSALLLCVTKRKRLVQEQRLLEAKQETAPRNDSETKTAVDRAIFNCLLPSRGRFSRGSRVPPSVLDRSE